MPRVLFDHTNETIGKTYNKNRIIKGKTKKYPPFAKCGNQLTEPNLKRQLFPTIKNMTKFWKA